MKEQLKFSKNQIGLRQVPRPIKVSVLRKNLERTVRSFASIYEFMYYVYIIFVMNI